MLSSSAQRDRVEDELFEAAERKELSALKFDEWVRFKDRFDKGLALFAKLDSNHCQVVVPMSTIPSSTRTANHRRTESIYRSMCGMFCRCVILRSIRHTVPCFVLRLDASQHG